MKDAVLAGSPIASGSKIRQTVIGEQHIHQSAVAPSVFPSGSHNSPRAEKHLEDIKARVVEPLDQWLGVVVCITRGLGDAVKFVAEPMVGTGGQRVYRLEPVSIGDAEGFSSALFDDARKSHFPEQLEEFVPLRRNVEQAMANFTVFGNNCCQQLRDTTKLPRPSHERPLGPFANFEAMLAASFRFWIIGDVPDFQKMLPDPSGIVTVFSNTSGQDVGRDRGDNVDVWLPAAISLLQNNWEKSDLPEQFKLLARDANHAVESLEEVRLIQFLPGLCKYING